VTEKRTESSQPAAFSGWHELSANVYLQNVKNLKAAFRPPHLVQRVMGGAPRPRTGRFRFAITELLGPCRSPEFFPLRVLTGALIWGLIARINT
jgi:hypothetical protein